MGGKPYRNTTTIANNNVVMTPNIQWDTLEVYDELDPTFGTWKYRKNTGAYSAAISSVGTAALRKTVITNTLGFTSVGISRATGEVNIVCWVPYNSAIKGAEYVNASWPGAGTTAWLTNTSGYSPANSLAALSPNLVLIELGLNDYNAAVSIPTFKANLATMITGAKATGADVMLVIPTPPDLSYGGGAPWQPYVDAEIDVGNTSDVPVIDLGAIFGGYSSSLTIDQVHYLELSNVWKAMAVDRALLMATQ